MLDSAACFPSRRYRPGYIRFSNVSIRLQTKAVCVISRFHNRHNIIKHREAAAARRRPADPFGQRTFASSSRTFISPKHNIMHNERVRIYRPCTPCKCHVYQFTNQKSLYTCKGLWQSNHRSAGLANWTCGLCAYYYTYMVLYIPYSRGAPIALQACIVLRPLRVAYSFCFHFFVFWRRYTFI